MQRCILTVKQFKSKYSESVESFCEEAIVRRELSDNFCFYNDKYDSVDGAYDWAKTTLAAHRLEGLIRITVRLKHLISKSYPLTSSFGTFPSHVLFDCVATLIYMMFI